MKKIKENYKISQPTLEEYIEENYKKIANSGYYARGSRGSRFFINNSPGDWVSTWQTAVGSFAFFLIFINFWYTFAGLGIIFLLEIIKVTINRHYLKKEYEKIYPSKKI